MHMIGTWPHGARSLHAPGRLGEWVLGCYNSGHIRATSTGANEVVYTKVSYVAASHRKKNICIFWQKYDQLEWAE